METKGERAGASGKEAAELGQCGTGNRAKASVRKGERMQTYRCQRREARIAGGEHVCMSAVAARCEDEQDGRIRDGGAQGGRR